MKEKYLDHKSVRSIDDIDLNDPFHLKHCLQQWDILNTLSEQHLKVKDLFMELEAKWYGSRLSHQQRRAMLLYLVHGYTQKEAGDKLGMGTRAVAKAVEEGIVTMSEYGATHDRG